MLSMRTLYSNCFSIAVLGIQYTYLLFASLPCIISSALRCLAIPYPLATTSPLVLLPGWLLPGSLWCGVSAATLFNLCPRGYNTVCKANPINQQVSPVPNAPNKRLSLSLHTISYTMLEPLKPACPALMVMCRPCTTHTYFLSFELCKLNPAIPSCLHRLLVLLHLCLCLCSCPCYHHLTNPAPASLYQLLPSQTTIGTRRPLSS